MENMVQTLKGEINQFLDLLGRGGLFSYPADAVQSLRGEAKSLAGKLGSIESSFLTIGLLGGTGVGKSSIMNALAGSEVASTSHRRPHTDQVLVYRHFEANPLPALALGDVPWREIEHKSHVVKHILLCDLPDFDSLMGRHRDHVLGFLEHLDILVWITSPEKYGDGLFYEFLQSVPKARRNFCFVLNKLDLLFPGQSLEDGYERLERLTRSFHEHLQQHGIDEPMLYPLSARDAMDTTPLAPWNQFPAFRRHIFLQRDYKQVMAIKAANLDVEVQKLFSALQRETLNLEAVVGILDRTMDEWRLALPEWVEAGRKALHLWLEQVIGEEILSRRHDPALLIGPGRVLALFFHQIGKVSKGRENTPDDPAYFMPPEERFVVFRRRLEWLEARVTRRILRQNLPSVFRERLLEILDVEPSSQDLGEQFSSLLSLRMAHLSLPSPRGFKAFQFITYALLMALFFMAIGAETAWREVLQAPGAANLFGLLLSIIHTLFSPKGFAALGSYILVNLFFACRFYGSGKRRLHRLTRKTITSFNKSMGKIWEEKLDSIFRDLNQFKEELKSRISAISALEKEGKR
jgi:hypothetical protein